jgi:hypothetical protein
MEPDPLIKHWPREIAGVSTNPSISKVSSPAASGDFPRLLTAAQFYKQIAALFPDHTSRTIIREVLRESQRRKRVL